MPTTVGVVAIQGDYAKHLEAFSRLDDAPNLRRVRTPDELDGVDRLVIPGGESTTVGMLMERFGLGEAIQRFADAGHPLWGTCMGMILMAREIEGRDDQYRLNLLDITVRRNAFGAQVHSFETEVPVVGLDEALTAVFIRAPIVVRTGPGVEVLSEFEGQVVGVRQGNRIGTSFHPELTEDTRLHAWFTRL